MSSTTGLKSATPKVFVKSPVPVPVPWHDVKSPTTTTSSGGGGVPFVGAPLESGALEVRDFFSEHLIGDYFDAARRHALHSLDVLIAHSDAVYFFAGLLNMSDVAKQRLFQAVKGLNVWRAERQKRIMNETDRLAKLEIENRIRTEAEARAAKQAAIAAAEAKQAAAKRRRALLLARANANVGGHQSVYEDAPSDEDDTNTSAIGTAGGESKGDELTIDVGKPKRRTHRRTKTPLPFLFWRVIFDNLKVRSTPSIHAPPSSGGGSGGTGAGAGATSNIINRLCTGAIVRQIELAITAIAAPPPLVSPSSHVGGAGAVPAAVFIRTRFGYVCTQSYGDVLLSPIDTRTTSLWEVVAPDVENRTGPGTQYAFAAFRKLTAGTIIEELPNPATATGGDAAATATAASAKAGTLPKAAGIPPPPPPPAPARSHHHRGLSRSNIDGWLHHQFGWSPTTVKITPTSTPAADAAAPSAAASDGTASAAEYRIMIKPIERPKDDHTFVPESGAD